MANSNTNVIESAAVLQCCSYYRGHEIVYIGNGIHHSLILQQQDSFETSLSAGRQGVHGGGYLSGESAEGPAKYTGEIPILQKASGLRPS